MHLQVLSTKNGGHLVQACDEQGCSIDIKDWQQWPSPAYVNSAAQH